MQMKRIMSACLTSMLLGTTLPAMAQTDPQSQTSQPQSSQSATSQSQSQSGQSKSGQSQAGNPARVMSESTTVKATVEDINKSQRLVTLKDQDGNTVKLKVGPAARNFDKLQKGDVVTAKFYQSAAVMLAKPGTEPTGAEQMQYVVRPETGEPGGMVVNSIQTTATVEDMNPQTREVTLKDA